MAFHSLTPWLLDISLQELCQIRSADRFRTRKLQNNNMFPASILKFSRSKMIGFCVVFRNGHMLHRNWTRVVVCVTKHFIETRSLRNTLATYGRNHLRQNEIWLPKPHTMKLYSFVYRIDLCDEWMRIDHKVSDLWPLTSMKSVEWASQMLEINQRTGIWWKNRCGSNWSRFSAAENLPTTYRPPTNHLPTTSHFSLWGLLPRWYCGLMMQHYFLCL